MCQAPPDAPERLLCSAVHLSRHRALPAVLIVLLTAACGSSASRDTAEPSRPPHPSGTAAAVPADPSDPSAPAGPAAALPGMPPTMIGNVYGAAGPNQFSPVVRGHRALVYVPNTKSDDVYVIDQRTFRVVDRFAGGAEPQHVVPSYDLRTLYVAADEVPGGSLIPIDPKTGRPGPPKNVRDPYNLYFTPDGRYGIVVAEAYRRLDFYDPRTWRLADQVEIPDCKGLNHMDFSADGRLLLVSCEFAGKLAVVDVARRQFLRILELPGGPGGMPQDVRLAPDGSAFYAADMMAGGVYLIDGAATRVLGLIRTGEGAHGLYFDRTATRLFVTNRSEGSISVLSVATRRPVAKWRLPGQASPDMGGVSADGSVLWLSGRYHGVVYALSTKDGRVIASVPVGDGPHGLCVWPQPGRYSLGHTGILR